MRKSKPCITQLVGVQKKGPLQVTRAWLNRLLPEAYKEKVLIALISSL